MENKYSLKKYLQGAVACAGFILAGAEKNLRGGRKKIRGGRLAYAPPAEFDFAPPADSILPPLKNSILPLGQN